MTDTSSQPQHPVTPAPQQEAPQSAPTPAPSPAHPAHPAHPARKKMSWAAAFVIFAAISAVFLFLILKTFFAAPGAVVDKSLEIAEKVKQSVVEITNIQPRVVVNSRVHYEQSATILELALTTRQTLVEREMDHTWLGSTKRIRLRGVYVVKSGFDLSRPFTIVVEGNRAIIKLPPARILSCEAKNLEVMRLDDGLWNKINPEDVEFEVNSLALMAREKMLQEKINAEAEKAITEKLRDRLGADIQLDIQIGQTGLTPVIKG